MATQLHETHARLDGLRADELVALKSSVVASIGEFKGYLLRSFSQLQQALETNAIKTSERADAESRATLVESQQNTERISRALLLCEQICRDIEEVRDHHPFVNDIRL